MNVIWWRNVVMASAITVPLAPTVHVQNQLSDVAQARSTSSDRTEPVIFVGSSWQNACFQLIDNTDWTRGRTY
ncbi:hypothetical protein [Bacillus sp. 1P02SD]|uniref:hypothetical protein n=1 Tax=Bacillus sp. 1P02SD TaxID=3132264 RepID=UPI0039A273D1